jgi:hypothetical protein
VFLVLLVGLDRIFLGVHNGSDVLAGYAVGFFWVLLGIIVYDPSPRRKVVEALPSPVPESKQLAVVLNPIKVDDVDAFKAMVEEQARLSGWSTPEWHETTVEDPGRSMAEEAAINGAGLVLVCGGDGTVRTVCAELAGTGVSRGPSWHRQPAGPQPQHPALPPGRHRRRSTARTGRSTWSRWRRQPSAPTSACGDGGMGFDAADAEAPAARSGGARIGWLAYFVVGFKASALPRDARGDLHGRRTVHAARARTVVIGNVGYLTAGVTAPRRRDRRRRARPVLVPTRFLSWLPLVWRVMASKGQPADDAEPDDRQEGRPAHRARDPAPAERRPDGD